MESGCTSKTGSSVYNPPSLIPNDKAQRSRMRDLNKGSSMNQPSPPEPLLACRTVPPSTPEASGYAGSLPAYAESGPCSSNAGEIGSYRTADLKLAIALYSRSTIKCNVPWKGPIEMLELLPQDIDAYCRSHTSAEAPIFKEIIDYTNASESTPQMLSGYLVGAVLQLLIRSLGATRVVEVGSFTGYGTLKMAEALPPEGEVHALELDASRGHKIREFSRLAGWESKVKIHIGPALESLQELAGPFDLAFIDADKENYPNYYAACKALVRRGGVIVIDNALFSGQVLDPQQPAAQAIDDTNTLITDDSDVANVLLPLRDGLMIAQLL